MQAPRSPVGQAWHPALRRRRTSPGQRREEDIPRKSAPNVCSQWRDGRKMEDRSFKAYLMSDPQHTARGEGGGGSTRQSVWVFVSSYLFSMSVCRCACRCPTSSVWDGAVCRVAHLLCVTCRLPLSRGTMMHLSRSSATKSQLGAAVTWKLHTTSTHTESNETPLVWTPLRPGFGQETLTY